MFDEDEVLREISDAMSRRRGYADSRSWPLDRQLEERGLVEDFISATDDEPGAPFTVLDLSLGERIHPIANFETLKGI